MTKQNAVQKYSVAAIADILSHFGIPTATAMQIYSDVLEKRASEALEILLLEVRQGNFKNVDKNDVISVLARFQRDAMEGVARNNLLLMARVINGMADKQELKAPIFLRYANILASLSKEEIIVLGIMARYKSRPELKNMPSAGEYGMEYKDPEKDELKAKLPNYPAIQQALTRTGLVFFTVNSQAAEDFKLDGGNFSDTSGTLTMPINSKIDYQLTPLMDEILKYTDFLTMEIA